MKLRLSRWSFCVGASGFGGPGFGHQVSMASMPGLTTRYRRKRWLRSIYRKWCPNKDASKGHLMLMVYNQVYSPLDCAPIVVILDAQQFLF